MESSHPAVQDAIMKAPVIMFSKTSCPFCHEAKDVFKRAGVEFKVVELNNESNGGGIQSTLQAITGQRTVPNIFIGGTHVGGCSELKSKVSNGEVKALLDKNNIPHKL